MNRTTVPSTPAAARIPADRQLKHLAALSGLTGFERDFVAQLRANDSTARPRRYKAVLRAIWQKHGRAL